MSGRTGDRMHGKRNARIFQCSFQAEKIDPKGHDRLLIGQAGAGGIYPRNISYSSVSRRNEKASVAFELFVGAGSMRAHPVANRLLA